MDNKYSRAISAMIHTNRMHRKAIEMSVDATGIHRSQHHLLMHIAKGGSLISQKEIAKQMGISPAAVATALAKLEKAGYITRQSGEDNRFNEITITQSGIDVVEISRRHFGKIDEALFYGFSDEEICVYCEFMLRMQSNAQRILDEKEKKNEEMV